MLYPFLLLLHSWLRWLVVLSSVVVLARSAQGAWAGRTFSPLDRRLGALFLSALDTQVLLGLVLYFFVSPLTPRSLSDVRAFMPVAPLRFFAVEHIFGMLVALAAAHVGWARGKRAPTDTARHRRIAIGVGLAVLAIVVSIPWPGLRYARPLLRMP